MTEPIFEHMVTEAGQAGSDIGASIVAGMEAGEELAQDLWRGFSDRFHHHRYDDRKPNSGVPEETMDLDLAAVAADIRNDLQQAEDKAGEVYNHAKAVLEEKLPAIEGAVKDISSDPLFKLAYDATIPASVRALIADFGAKVVALVPAQAEAPAAEAEQPAEAAPAA